MSILLKDFSYNSMNLEYPKISKKPIAFNCKVIIMVMFRLANLNSG